jgi:tetraacyldisaccharide 4'-kinase
LSRADLDDHLLPAGNLRETLHAAERAHVMAIPSDDAELDAAIRARGRQAVIWRLRRHMEIPLVDGPVAAFCGIARPNQFFNGLEQAGLRIATRRAFPDHYAYTGADVDGLATQAQAAGAVALLTTGKDQIRLGAFASPIPLKTVALRIEIEDEAAALDWLIRRVSGTE